MTPMRSHRSRARLRPPGEPRTPAGWSSGMAAHAVRTPFSAAPSARTQCRRVWLWSRSRAGAVSRSQERARSFLGEEIEPLGFVRLFRSGRVIGLLASVLALQTLHDGEGDVWQVYGADVHGWGTKQLSVRRSCRRRVHPRWAAYG